MSEACKETLCTICQHREICKFKEDYLKIVETVSNMRISQEKPDGKIESTPLSNFEFLGKISIACKYYTNWTVQYRDNKDTLAFDKETGIMKRYTPLT